jgi:excisionase family DNA binding protein
MYRKVFRRFGFVKAISTCTPEYRVRGSYMEELVSIKEAARRLGGVSVHTVQAWISKGRLPRTKVGARTMIRERDLQAFISACNPEPVTHGTPNESSGGER